MTKQRRMIYLVSAALVVCLAVLFIHQLRQDSPLSALTFTVGSDASGQTVTLWENEEGESYVFLPSFAQPEQVKIHLDTAVDVRMGDILLEDGMDCTAFSWNIPYTVSYTFWGMPRSKTVTFLHSGRVATMFIDTQSGNMAYIHEEKGNEETGMMTLYTEEGGLNFAGALSSISGRGNNTWESFEKKPYSIQLTQEADLLGMGAAQKWVLLANADDSSNLRNKIVYDFAGEIGLPYSPDTQWVDLYLNGEYAGLYLLSERNEIHPERVAVAQDSSFLVSLERYDRIYAQNYPHVATQNRQFLRVHSAEDTQTMEQISKTLQSVENALMAEDGIDPVSGKHWDELIDTQSWIRKYLVEEVFGSGDACYISQFFYTDGALDGIVYAGPVWDFDHCIGSPAGWQLQYPNSLYANRLHVKDGFDAPWFYSLYHKEAFYQEMTSMYESAFLPALQELSEETISTYAERIQYASLLNRVRWSQPDVSTLEEAAHLSKFMRQRAEFLSDLWLEENQYHTIKMDQGYGAFYGYVLVEPGTCFDDLPVLASTPTATFVGWFYKDTDQPFDKTQPITADLEIYAKWEKSLTNKLDDYVKLIPLGILGMFGLVLLLVEIRRSRKRR